MEDFPTEETTEDNVNLELSNWQVTHNLQGVNLQLVIGHFCPHHSRCSSIWGPPLSSSFYFLPLPQQAVHGAGTAHCVRGALCLSETLHSIFISF